MVFRLPSQSFRLPAKHFCSTSSMMATEVDAPGDAPSRAARLPSWAWMTSVPNCRLPCSVAVSLMICTRCPAWASSQSSSRASGINSRNSWMRCALLSNTCPIRYWVRARFLTPAASMVRKLCGLSVAGKSQIEPCLRNLVVKPANGPNSRAFLPSI